MAFRSSRFRKFRRSIKRRPTRRFKRLGRRVSRRTGQTKYLFKRTMVTSYNIGADAAWLAGGTLYVPAQADQEFILNDVPNTSEFTNLYDSYKICAVKNKFVFDMNSGSGNSNQTALPTLLTVNDYNDSAVITSEDDILQYPSFKAKRIDKVISRYFKPKALTSIDGNTAKETRGWISTGSASVKHYGLKWAVRNPNSGTAVVSETLHLRVYTTFYLAFKGVK